MKATDLKAQQEAKDKQAREQQAAKPAAPAKPAPKSETEELLDTVEEQSLTGEQQVALGKLRKLLVKGK